MRLDDNRSRRCAGIIPAWRTLLLFTIAVLTYWIAGNAPEGLVLSRQALAQGDLWSLISGHWVHSDRQHATWNIAALLVLGVLFEPILKQRLFTDMVIASLLLSLWVYVFMPALPAYCGLSGILNTLLVSGCLALWQQQDRPFVLLLILILALAKNLFEVFHQQAIFTQTAWPSVPEAHLAGMAIGWLLFFIRTCLNNSNDRNPVIFLKH